MNSTKEINLVTVIVPSYNSAKFLPETISSVLNQSYTNLELIIVDDGSTDNTSEVVNSYLSDSRCVYIKKANAGVSLARNDGAKIAKGSYIAFLDADDLLLEESIKEKVKVLDAMPEIGLVHSDVKLIDERGNYLGKEMTGLTGKNSHVDILLWNECVIPAPSSNAIMRKAVFDEVGGYDPLFSTAADQDFLIRVCSRYQIYRIEKALTAYRIVGGSMGKNVAVFERDHLGVFNKEKHLLNDDNLIKLSLAKLHLIIASSWWVHHKKISKTLKHLVLSLSYSPKPFFVKAKKIFA